MILLSFDIEEFDMPKEYDYDIPFEDQIKISRKGLIHILDLLKKYHCKATFFSTVVFAKENRDLINRLLAEGHELASHTYYHSEFKNEHLSESKQALEKEFNVEVFGLRMPRMAEISTKKLKDAGYKYASSVNPTFLPGRYKKNHISRKYFKENGLWQIPTAVSTWFRIPLFWLSFHNFPLNIYKWLVKKAIKSEGYAVLYFHPWEFTDLDKKEYNFPFYVRKNTGEKMINRFESLLKWIQKNNIKTESLKNLVKE